MLEINDAFNSDHNHDHCVSDALNHAKAICQENGQRLTPIRELVLRLVWGSHKPLGAYELLPALAESGFNSAPPTVYRALDFLHQLGLIHKIGSLNAFVGCSNPEHPHPSAFMICTECKTAAEIETSELQTSFNRVAKTHGFKLEEENIELLGLCSDCRGSES